MKRARRPRAPPPPRIRNEGEGRPGADCEPTKPSLKQRLRCRAPTHDPRLVCRCHQGEPQVRPAQGGERARGLSEIVTCQSPDGRLPGRLGRHRPAIPSPETPPTAPAKALSTGCRRCSYRSSRRPPVPRGRHAALARRGTLTPPWFDARSRTPKPLRRECGASPPGSVGEWSRSLSSGAIDNRRMVPTRSAPEVCSRFSRLCRWSAPAV